MLAGSSLPVTWRLPDIELPLGCEIEDALMVGVGGSDPMDFHALEAMQCMVERRRGGETGVKAVQLIEGDAVWKAGERRPLVEGTADGRALAQRHAAGADGHRTAARRTWWRAGELPKLVKNPAAYFIEYRDGLQGDDADAQRRDEGLQFRGTRPRDPGFSRCSSC